MLLVSLTFVDGPLRGRNGVAQKAPTTDQTVGIPILLLFF